MKKLLSFIAVFMLFASININATTTKVSTESVLLEVSCFSWARGVVVDRDGEINLSNVDIVLLLNAWCETL